MLNAFIDPFPAELGALRVDPPYPAKMATQYFGPGAKPCTQNMMASVAIHENAIEKHPQAWLVT